MSGCTGIEGLRSLKVHLSTVKTMKMSIVTTVSRTLHIVIDCRWKKLIVLHGLCDVGPGTSSHVFGAVSKI